MKKILLIILLIIGISIPNFTEASMPPMYPVWGYNTQEHICQIKQGAADAPIMENLAGHYGSMRGCRSDNPEIILYTGEGILIWLGILLMIILFHHILFPKLKKRTQTEKILFTLQDIIIIGIVLFFTILLQHYFDVPHTSYHYESDADQIIYSSLIYPKTPLLFAIGYIIISFIKGIFMYKKGKE